MSAAISLFVGLGNPGEKYEKTRHNAGAWFVNALCQLSGKSLKPQAKFQGLHCITELHQQEVHLFVPTTFMNLSGQAVKSVMSYYKIPPAQLLVAHDEIDLAVNDTRLKWGGGHGGHNGLRDIIQHLGTPEFYRLRIGVSHPGHSKDVIDYVLHPPSQSEKIEIDASIHRALNIVPRLLKAEFQQAMQELNTKPKT